MFLARQSFYLALLIASICTASICTNGLLAAPVKKQDKYLFERDVLPILKSRCLHCHSGKSPKGGLNLSTRKTLMQGGESGAAIRIAAAETSLLWSKLAANEMPPGRKKLTAKEKGVIRTWINDGALGNPGSLADDELNEKVKDADKNFWSFKPPQRPQLPSVKDTRISNPIDRFIVAQLEKNHLQLSSPAKRVQLIRRLHFDLLGLPPSPADVEEFVQDQRPDAYEQLVDRLLAHPRYGERWGRHWLDVAGYADSAGILSEDRPLQRMYRYRDYVVQAFNKDKPYDVFLREQVAGDELYDYWTAYHSGSRLSPQIIEGLTATGFLRSAADSSRPDFVTIKNAASQYFYPTLNDTMKIVASATMGLTLQCAKCHTHKYDPIPQVEYYRMQAIFMSAYRVDKWVPQMERIRTTLTRSQEQAAKKRNAAVETRVKQLNAELKQLQQTFAKRYMDQQKALVPLAIRTDTYNAISTAPKDRTPVQKFLADKYRTLLRPNTKELQSILPKTYPKYAQEVAKRRQQISRQQSQRVFFDEIRALYDLPGKAKTPFLRRGDALTPGRDVKPGILTAINTPEPFRWQQRTNKHTTGRRLAFAKWLTQPRHPLTARVMVNRIWLHHFGVGIVQTPEDFGYSGARPSHPKLLDWLAVEFVERDWSIKQLHRLILTSRTYRQQSRLDPQSKIHRWAQETDPTNDLLWRQRMRRLEAEPVRDSVLQVAGILSSQMYGYPTRMARQSDGEVITSGGGTFRRSIYMQILRNNPMTMLLAFDQPVMETNCTQRSQSTVSTQALTQLNSDSMVRAATAMAKRVAIEGGKDPTGFAVRLAFGRPIDKTEQSAMTEFLTAQTRRYQQSASKPKVAAARLRALADLCHMLLCANEFIYID